VETAMWGHTSEDVAVNLMDGTFGMSRETGEFGLVLTRNRHRPDEERAIEEERKKCLQTFSNAPKVVHD
jgi:hypothetical protein